MKPRKPIRLIHILRHPDGKVYRMEAIDAESVSKFPNLEEDLYRNCHQGPIWDWIFSVFFPKGYQPEDAQAFLEVCTRNWEEEKEYPYGIFEGEKLVGMCDIKARDEEGRAEIGYWLDAAHSGLMTNAVAELISQAKGAGYSGLFAYTALENERSQGVLKRAGFRFSGLSELNRRGAKLDVRVFELPFEK